MAEESVQVDMAEKKCVKVLKPKAGGHPGKTDAYARKLKKNWAKKFLKDEEIRELKARIELTEQMCAKTQTIIKQEKERRKKKLLKKFRKKTAALTQIVEQLFDIETSSDDCVDQAKKDRVADAKPKRRSMTRLHDSSDEEAETEKHKRIILKLVKIPQERIILSSPDKEENEEDVQQRTTSHMNDWKIMAKCQVFLERVNVERFKKRSKAKPRILSIEKLRKKVTIRRRYNIRLIARQQNALEEKEQGEEVQAPVMDTLPVVSEEGNEGRSQVREAVTYPSRAGPAAEPPKCPISVEAEPPDVFDIEWDQTGTPLLSEITEVDLMEESVVEVRAPETDKLTEIQRVVALTDPNNEVRLTRQREVKARAARPHKIKDISSDEEDFAIKMKQRKKHYKQKLKFRKALQLTLKTKREFAETLNEFGENFMLSLLNEFQKENEPRDQIKETAQLTVLDDREAGDQMYDAMISALETEILTEGGMKSTSTIDYGQEALLLLTELMAPPARKDEDM